MAAPWSSSECPTRGGGAENQTAGNTKHRPRTMLWVGVAKKRTSLWLDTSADPGFPRLESPVTVDVAVLGGGITGLSTALLLKREGFKVAVVDQHSVGSGATGFTTAKVSSLNGLIHQQVRRRFGQNAARTHGEANEAGLAQI